MELEKSTFSFFSIFNSFRKYERQNTHMNMNFILSQKKNEGGKYTLYYFDLYMNIFPKFKDMQNTLLRFCRQSRINKLVLNEKKTKKNVLLFYSHHHELLVVVFI